MATIEQQPGQSASEFRTPEIGTAQRRSPMAKMIVTLVVGVLVVAAVAFLYSMLRGFVAQGDEDGALTYMVERTRLLVTVTEDGNVESVSNDEVKCLISGGSTILWIVEDGKQVEAGEEIVRLDSAKLEDDLNAQEIVYEKALAAKIQADENHSTATIAVQEYVQGTFVELHQQSESDIRIALENLRSAENIYSHTKRMARKGYVTTLQLEADKFGVERAQLDLKSAETRKKVLVEFTKIRMIKELEAARDTTAAHMRSEDAAFELEKVRMERLQDEFKKCEIKAPQNGMVVYANETGRRYRSNNQAQIEEGAQVREGQTLIRLPDLSNMQVKVTVHESVVDQIKIDMPARVRIGDKLFGGRVVYIANQPERTSWYSANVKEYATNVEIEGETEGLRPGMTAEVEILVADLTDVVAVPVTSVVELGDKFYCWVQTPDGPERRELLLGEANDVLIEVTDGVKVGDEVVRNPRAVLKEAREELPRDKAAGDENRFGKNNGPKPRTDGVPKRRPADTERNSSSDRADRPSTSGGPARPQGGFNLMQFDTDRDGKVSRSEAPEPMRPFFDRADGNSDGFIDKQEIEKLRKQFQQSGGRPGGSAGDHSANPGGRPR